ncbi:MAG: hypothetical protein JW717_02200, partial [Marinilabiliaceae bacterium]|nr:hypothetical protein [Marinilabiliaceae bacterium]
MQVIVNDFYADNSKWGYEIRDLSGLKGYTNCNCFPVTIGENELLTVNYYDDYNWLNCDVNDYFELLVSRFFNHGFNGVEVPMINKLDHIKGQLAGTSVKVLDNTNKWLTSVTFYNKRYQPVLIQKDNYIGGEDVILSDYNFTGLVNESWLSHTSNLRQTVKKIIHQLYHYDQQGRLTSIENQMTDSPLLTTIEQYEYNEVGQLNKKRLGGSTDSECVQIIDLMYDIQGRILQMNNPDIVSTGKRLFGMRIGYENLLDGLSGMPQYNGNVSSLEWRTPENVSTESPVFKQSYSFHYDAMNQ